MKKCNGFLKLLSMSLAMVVSVSTVPTLHGAVTVKAEESSKTITGLGTGTIGNPTQGGGNWDYVYYGKYDDINVKYRVLSTECMDFSDKGSLSKKTVLLDCDNVLYNLRPGNPAKLLEDLNDQGFLDADVFTDAEKDAIAFSRKEKKSNTDGTGVDGDFAQLKEMKIFVLDPKEATNESYGYENDRWASYNRIKKNIKNDKIESWWLRLGKDDTKLFDKQLYRITDFGSIDDRFASESDGISPAFNVERSSILFSSLIPGASDEYKLTIMDDKMVMPQDVKCSTDGEKARISFKYPYATVDDNISFSVLLLKDRYEKGKTVDDPSDFAYIPLDVQSEGQSGSGKNKYHIMNGTFELPSQSSGLKYAYLIYEKRGGSKDTDYACVPKYFELDSKNHVHAWEIDYLGAGDDNATVKCKDCSAKYKISITAASRKYGEDISAKINKPDDLPEEVHVSDVIYRDASGQDIDKSDVKEVGDYTAVAIINVVDENGDDQEVEIANNFKILPIVLLPSMVKLSEDRYVYDGTPKTPEVTVKVNGKELSKDEYTVEYKDNIDPGLATVKVYSDNPHYSDEVIKEFRIVDQSVIDKEEDAKSKIDDIHKDKDDKKSDEKEDDIESKIKDRIDDVKKEGNSTSGSAKKTESQVIKVNAASGHAAGDVVNGMGDTYIVSSAADTDLQVMFVKPRSSTASTVRIPSSVVIDGNEYRVTEIAEGVFNGNKKLKKVIIGDNVEKIGENAFYKCKKLKTIRIESTYLKKKNVGKNAFKKISKKAVVKVPKGKKKSYKKILKSAGFTVKAKNIVEVDE
ncbi:leucine-rich repeat protein [Butyrivibrio sp. JL13D10]|uniref:leucine-rich repeat protein n=1 Tax=Butyrivibrio sp. JL13D10 TaxID=3236815 RepID=UPI0038B45DCE